MESPKEVVVDKPAALAACLAHLAACDRIGMDTEFVGENTYHPELCLVQVATPTTLYLVDPLALPDLGEFWRLVVDPKRTVVVHAGREEIRLCHLACGAAPNAVDLQLAAGLIGNPYPMSHGALVQAVLGRRLKKSDTLTEWRTRPLAPSQVRYAFDDVRFLLAAWEQIEKQLASLDRLAWAQEEFDRLRDQSIPTVPGEDPVNEKWRKIKGLGSLDRRRLALVRELYWWRERKAHEWNRPARVVVRDDLLVEIARRAPKSPADYAVVRGLSHRWLDEIYSLYVEAQELPLDECPEVAEREIEAPQVSLTVQLLGAVLADFGPRIRVAPNLIATVSDLRRLVRAFAEREPLPDDTGLFRGWRRTAALPHFVALLEGRTTLRIADLARESPLAYGP